MVKKALINTSLKYGLAGGVFLSAPFFILLAIDQKPLINLNTLILEGLLTTLFIYFGLREYRDRWNAGILKFWEGMTMGFIIYIVGAIIATGILSTYLYLIEPDYLSTYKAELTEWLNDSLTKMDDPEEKELLQGQIGKVEETMTLDLIIDTITKKIVLGLIFTPICTVFLRRY